MATRVTILRNTGVFAQAAAQGKKVRFTYVDAQGVESKRLVTPVATQKTRHNPDALIVRAKDGLNDRSFRTDRALRARIVE